MDLFIRRLQKCDVFSELLSDLNNHSKLSQLAYCIQNCVEPLCVWYRYQSVLSQSPKQMWR